MRLKTLKLSLILIALFSISANAAEIKTTHGVLRALDKITGRTSTFAIEVVPERREDAEKIDIYLDEKEYEPYAVNFSTLTIIAKACFKTPPEETPENAVFLQIVDHKPNEEPSTIFSGWMFSSSPALSAIEHSVYDIWVLKCGSQKEVEDFVAAENKKINVESKVPPLEENTAEPVLDLDD